VPDDGVTVMRRWFEAWNRGDLDAFSALYAEDAVMVPPAGWVETGAISGRTAIRRFFEGLKEAWEGEDSAVINEISAVRDLVVTRMEWRVRGRVSGIDTHLAITNVSTLNGAEIVRQQHYLEHDEALRDIGEEA
jgi:ketosteroid isomerase-like protein